MSLVLQKYFYDNYLVNKGLMTIPLTSLALCFLTPQILQPFYVKIYLPLVGSGQQGFGCSVLN